MDTTHLPRVNPRSFLFAAASNARHAERALDSAADAAILDLEDAVAPAEKPAARATVAELLGRPPGATRRLVRINAVDTPWFADDVALVADAHADAVVLPKATVDALVELPASLPPIYALVESATGLRDAYALAASERVAGLMLGAVDLAADLGLEPFDDGTELLFARSQLVRDSRAADALPPVDGVWTRLEDSAGLMREATRARALGMRGKLCIHPSQVEVVHTAFAPAPDARRWAERVVEAYEQATAQGQGAVSVDGEMVDVAVVERAQRLLRESEGT